MGCNICLSNRENYIEQEFKYAIDDLNIQNAEQNIENVQNNEIKSSINDNKIKNDISDKNTDKSKEILPKKFIPLNPEVKIEEKKDIDINNPNSSIKTNEKENIKINIENKVNENNNEGNKLIKDKMIKIENLSNNPKINEIEDKTKNNLSLNILKSCNKMENGKGLGISKNNMSINSIVSSSNKNDYNTRIIDLINQVRTNPKQYSDIILENMRYIYKRVKIVADDITGQNEEKIEYYFQKKKKVELYRGEEAFIEAAKYLDDLKPLNELKIKDEIRINILPETEEQIQDDRLLIKNQLYEIKKQFNISAFFKDNVKNPEIGLMLMIIGDYKNSQNKKRNAILNPDYKYIAVNSKFINNKFVSYFTFSK